MTQPEAVPAERRRIALLTIDCIDEWLDGLHLGMEDFSRTECGGWFNALHALVAAGYEVLLVGTSARLDRTTSFRNAPTGALVVMLPASRLYRRLKQLLAWAQQRPSRKPCVAILASLQAYASLPVGSFRRLLRKHAVDALLIEQYGIARADISVLATRGLGLPVVGMYSSAIPESGSMLVRTLRRYMTRQMDAFAICSSREAERLASVCRIPANKLHDTLFPVDTDFWQPQPRVACRSMLGLPAAARICVWHGCFDIAVKGLDTLIAAWSQVRQRHPTPDWRLLIIGNRVGSAPLRHLIAAAGADGITLIDRWLHDRSEIRCYLGAADVFVFPSRTEAFGIAPLEAMACGLPALLSDAAGVAELFAGEEDGVIRLQPDRIEPWVAAISKLLLEPTLCDSLGNSARRAVVDNASIAAGANAFAALLDRHLPVH